MQIRVPTSLRVHPPLTRQLGFVWHLQHAGWAAPLVDVPWLEHPLHVQPPVRPEHPIWSVALLVGLPGTQRHAVAVQLHPVLQ
eukprot:3553404-Pyramimonas_sp.AAC.2